MEEMQVWLRAALVGRRRDRVWAQFLLENVLAGQSLCLDAGWRCQRIVRLVASGAQDQCHDSKFCIFSFWNNFRFTESCKDSTEWSLLLASPGGYILQNYSMISNETTVDTGTSDKPHPRLHSLDGTPAMLQPRLSAIQANPRLGCCCAACTACSLFVYNVLFCFVFLETMRRPKRTAS